MSFEEKTSRSFDELLADGGSAEDLYSELRASFELEKANASSDEELKQLRDRWLGRKNGLLSPRMTIGSRPLRAS